MFENIVNTDTYMGYFVIKKMMSSKVVSTKLTEEEYGKLIGLCSASGYTVSKLLKRAILERMNEEVSREESTTPRPVFESAPRIIQKPQEKKIIESDDRFQYY